MLILFLSASRGMTEEPQEYLALADLESFSADNPFASKLPIPPPVIETAPPSTEQPTGPNIGGQMMPGLQTDVKQEKQTPLPELVLTGLVWNSKRPQAIINGSVVDIGDRIADVEIVAIQKDGVDVKFLDAVTTIKP